MITSHLGRITNGLRFMRNRLRQTPWKSRSISAFREFHEDRRTEFQSRGYNKKEPFFAHRVYYLPKAGPDAYKLARRMCGEMDPNNLWEVVLYAIRPAIDEFPEQLFFDNDLIWHQQQFGMSGHVAFAYLVLKEDRLYTLNHVSDLVQRQSRRTDYKTRIEKKFHAWHHLLFNSIMNFALENSIQEVCSPTSDLAIKHTDPDRTVQRELFERVYDGAVCTHFRTRKENEWWVSDLSENKERIVIPDKKEEVIEHGKMICLCHDVERGFGHLDVDSDFARHADDMAPGYLEEMLNIEKEMRIRATYNVLGCFLNDVREKIERNGHCVAFHSYDHRMEMNQLGQCRQIDYRIRGYRPPQSKLTPELSDKHLCFYNFDWLASSPRSLGVTRPQMVNRIVKVPLLFDDFDLHTGRRTYPEWEQMALDIISKNDFVAFSLHDCYAHHWLPYYRDFLKKIQRLGVFKTLDEVANKVVLENSKGT